MRKKILAVVVCLSMVIGVCGCGNTKETDNDAKATEEIKETESEVEKETEVAEEETEEAAEEETEPIYTVTASDLASIAQDFFVIQAKQYFNSGNLSSHYPTTINKMKDGYNLNIVSDWDENNFGGLEQSFNIIKGGLAIKAGYTTNYSISVSSVANNFNNSYRYYVNSDAELVIAAKISVSSSIEHIENKNGSNEGYVSVHYKLRSGSTDDWEIYGVGQFISSGNKTITAELIREEIDWNECMVFDEDTQKIIDNLLDDSAPEWKKVYINYFNKLDLNWESFNLVDLDEDEDGIPEICYCYRDGYEGFYYMTGLKNNYSVTNIEGDTIRYNEKYVIVEDYPEGCLKSKAYYEPSPYADTDGEYDLVATVAYYEDYISYSQYSHYDDNWSYYYTNEEYCTGDIIYCTEAEIEEKLSAYESGTVIDVNSEKYDIDDLFQVIADYQ